MLNKDPYKILIAEDDDLNYIIVSRIVSNYPKLNLKAERAENGLEVLEKMGENKHFKLIIMDMQMPEMDGFEATRVLRSQGNNLPIIGFTAFALNSEGNNIIDSGCNEYLTKPLNITQLYDIFDKYLS